MGVKTPFPQTRSIPQSKPVTEYFSVRAAGNRCDPETQERNVPLPSRHLVRVRHHQHAHHHQLVDKLHHLLPATAALPRHPARPRHVRRFTPPRRSVAAVSRPVARRQSARRRRQRRQERKALTTAQQSYRPLAAPCRRRRMSAAVGVTSKQDVDDLNSSTSLS